MFDGEPDPPHFKNALEWIVLAWILDGDPAQVRELCDGGLAAEAAVARALNASERHLSLVSHRRTVDVANTGLDLLGNLHGALNITAEHGRGQAILGVVCNANSFSVVLDADDAFGRSEGLLAVDAHAGKDMVH